MSFTKRTLQTTDRRLAFSNFAVSPICMDGITYQTAEAAYQAGKTDDPVARQQLAEAQIPIIAKQLGRHVPLKTNWNRVAEMEKVLRMKFAPGTKWAQRLVASGNRELIEWNTWCGCFWGRCRCTCCKDQGENILGILLMKLRAELQVSTLVDSPATSATYRPPDQIGATGSLELVVTDRAGIETGVRVSGSYVVISIHSADTPRPKVKKQSGLQSVLQLVFHDAEPSHLSNLGPEITLMSVEQARQIWEFVREHLNKIDALMVHCEAGMSRSPAVAAALCKGLGGDDRSFWRDYQPNRYVYDLVLAATEQNY